MRPRSRACSVQQVNIENSISRFGETLALIFREYRVNPEYATAKRTLSGNQQQSALAGYKILRGNPTHTVILECGKIKSNAQASGVRRYWKGMEGIESIIIFCPGVTQHRVAENVHALGWRPACWRTSVA